MPRTKEVYQQIRDERREQILDIAAEVFARKGFANTKTSDLTEAAGISQGLLYHYFADKEEVFAALIRRITHGMMRWTQGALEQSGTPWEKLRWLTEQLLQGISRRPVYYQLFAQALVVPGRVRTIIQEMEDLRKTLRQLITEGQAAGQVSKSDPDQLVLLYLCFIGGLAAGAWLFHDALEARFPDGEVVLKILKPEVLPGK